MSEVMDRILNATGLKEAVPPTVAKLPEDTTAKPPMFAVVLHNDGSTNPEFVMHVLSSAFSVDNSKAADLMLTAHKGGSKGHAVVKITTRDTAETQLQAAGELIARATAGQDFFVFPGNTGGQCELKFTVEAETAGDA